MVVIEVSIDELLALEDPVDNDAATKHRTAYAQTL